MEIVRAAIEHGADVGARDTYKRTAVHVAVSYNNADTIDALVEGGASIEAHPFGRQTPPQLGWRQAPSRRRASPFEYGTTVNAQNNSLRTLLMYSAEKASTEGTAEVVDSTQGGYGRGNRRRTKQEGVRSYDLGHVQSNTVVAPWCLLSFLYGCASQACTGRS